MTPNCHRDILVLEFLKSGDIFENKKCFVTVHPPDGQTDTIVTNSKCETMQMVKYQGSKIHQRSYNISLRRNIAATAKKKILSNLIYSFELIQVPF